MGGLTEEGFCWCGEEEWRETGTEHGRIGCPAKKGGMMDWSDDIKSMVMELR